MTSARLFTRTSLSLILGASLTACAVGPTYQRPVINTPNELKQLPVAQAVQALPKKLKQVDIDWLHWWRTFNDPVLDQLLEEAAYSNQDIQLAAARVEEAQAQSVYTNLSRYPGIDANVGASRAKISETTGRAAPGIRTTNNNFLASLAINYEIDFWGKYSRANEAARARLLAQQANLGTVKASLYASVAQSYFALRAFDAQHELAQSTLQTRLEHRRLQEKRFQAGVIGEQDWQQTLSEVASAEIQRAQARQNQQLAETALAILLGRSPAAIAKPEIARGKNLQGLFDQVALPAELPAEILTRRPDLVAAEQSLIAANADIGQAKAQYFPSIKLTSGSGYESRNLADLIQPSSMLWNLGANLAQPVFRGGLISSLINGAKARKNQALAQYVQSVQFAFRDVHDALVNVAANEEIVTAAQTRQQALKETLRLVNLRYTNGYSSYLEVLNAQRDLFQVESTLIDTQRAQLAATVSLYKALGGGWAGQQLK
ncbi:efflux transporter outer membrane subunit [Parvibium lacunae]|uniref:Transporter n=1 Tax=Parvibium lacunae TaxID=1888893 RepID=A0A368L1A1_9BURK|nr:efflux transporter outer membrane subunit [Parvibium lacunae]RCS56869.1 transporter [Parvibium lacunae]